MVVRVGTGADAGTDVLPTQNRVLSPLAPCTLLLTNSSYCRRAPPSLPYVLVPYKHSTTGRPGTSTAEMDYLYANVRKGDLCTPTDTQEMKLRYHSRCFALLSSRPRRNGQTFFLLLSHPRHPPPFSPMIHLFDCHGVNFVDPCRTGYVHTYVTYLWYPSANALELHTYVSRRVTRDGWIKDRPCQPCFLPATASHGQPQQTLQYISTVPSYFRTSVRRYGTYRD